MHLDYGYMFIQCLYIAIRSTWMGNAYYKHHLPVFEGLIVIFDLRQKWYFVGGYSRNMHCGLNVAAE